MISTALAPSPLQKRSTNRHWAHWLAKHLAGFAGPLKVESFKGGQSNPTYKLTTGTHTYVMRAKPGPVAKLLPSAHAIEREFAEMTGLAGSAVPVPQMLCLCEDESVIGRAFYIMSYVEGRIYWEQSLPGMTPAQRAEIYDATNLVIAALHSIDVARTGFTNVENRFTCARTGAQTAP